MAKPRIVNCIHGIRTDQPCDYCEEDNRGPNDGK